MGPVVLCLCVNGCRGQYGTYGSSLISRLSIVGITRLIRSAERITFP